VLAKELLLCLVECALENAPRLLPGCFKGRVQLSPHFCGKLLTGVGQPWVTSSHARSYRAACFRGKDCHPTCPAERPVLDIEPPFASWPRSAESRYGLTIAASRRQFLAICRVRWGVSWKPGLGVL
jgi:hypothetical protein